MDHRLVDIPVLERSVELVRPRLEDDRHEAARRVAQFRGYARRIELHFLERVLRGRYLRIGSIRIADARLLTVHAIDRVPHGARALPQHGEPADRIRPRHVEQNADRTLLAHRDLHQQVAVEHLAGRRGLGIEQRRCSGHLNAVRYRADFELHVHARNFAGPNYQALSHVALEPGSFYRHPVRARREVWRLVRAIGIVCVSVVNEFSGFTTTIFAATTAAPEGSVTFPRRVAVPAVWERRTVTQRTAQTQGAVSPESCRNMDTPQHVKCVGI